MDNWADLKTVWAILSLAGVAVLMLIVWRLRGIFSWQRSLRKELALLQSESRGSEPPRQQGIAIIANQCRTVLSAVAPDVGQLADLQLFIRSIAACYYPDAARPEFQVSIGRLLRSIEHSAQRFNLILKRRGFRRLERVSIGNVKRAYRRYRRLTASPWWTWYRRHRLKLQGLSFMRMLVFPDPFIWLAYLSNRLTLVLLTKYLMVDLYLFCGQLALNAYDPLTEPVPAEKAPELEEALNQLAAMASEGELQNDPEILKWRRELVGVTTFLKATPGIREWRRVIGATAQIIARRHFPASEAPLEEAAIGPLLASAEQWVNRILKAEAFPVARSVLRLRIETIYSTQSISMAIIPKPMWRYLEKSLVAYGWMRWPMRVYRWAQRRSPWVIAWQVGWYAARKSAMAYVYGRLFDTACRELETIYAQSRNRRRSRETAPPKGSEDR